MENNRIENSDFKKLIGKWKTEGRILKTKTAPEMKITGTDIYEIILDGFFILHTADVLMGNEKSKTHEIIGLDVSNNQAFLQHYNNQGNSGKMTGSIINNDFVMYGNELRFTGQFNQNNTKINGKWEKLTDEKIWTEFLIMNFTKLE